MSTQRVSSVKISLFDKKIMVMEEEDDAVSSSGQPKISGCS